MDKRLKALTIIVSLIVGVVLLYIDHLNNRVVSLQNINDKLVTIINIPSDHSNFTVISAIGILLISIGLLLGVQLFFSKQKNYDTISQLSRQEIKIKSLIQQGMTNKEIALELAISPSTVKSHINNIYRKLNINSRSDLY